MAAAGNSFPKPQFVDATETSIQVKFPATQSPSTLEWKAHGQTNIAGSVDIPVGATTAEAMDLEPGSTYALRLRRSDGGESPELIVDTEQVGCTPQQKSGCCVIS